MKAIPIKPGVHSIPEMHTIYKHIEQFPHPASNTLRESWKYACGELPPHYSVPQVQEECVP